MATVLIGIVKIPNTKITMMITMRATIAITKDLTISVNDVLALYHAASTINNRIV